MRHPSDGRLQQRRGTSGTSGTNAGMVNRQAPLIESISPACEAYALGSDGSCPGAGSPVPCAPAMSAAIPTTPGPVPAPAPGGRYSRQAIFAPLGAEGQARLESSRVLIVGCGALGSRSAELLARAGVGLLRLVDRDVVELSNLHRSGFDEADARAGTPKAEALARRLGLANSTVILEPRVQEFAPATALDLCQGIDLVLDGLDNVPTRFLLNDASLRLGLPWIYCGVVGETGHAQLFLPGAGPCLRCILPHLSAAGELPTCDTAGVLGPAVSAIASFQAAMALRCLAGGRDAALALAGLQVRLGVWSPAAAISRTVQDPECPACAGGSLEFLAGGSLEDATVLCGRSAVQVRPASGPASLDLPSLAARLRPLGSVEEGRFLLRFDPGGHRMTIFADGRAIIEGTTDPTRARALHARYVGS